jgi:hypothetical protein
VQVQEKTLPNRALMTGFWIAALFVIVLAAKGYPKAAFGFSIGSALSLFSLWSLTFGVPRLLVPGATSVKLFFALLMMVKLPLYAGVLYFAVGSPMVDIVALFCGAGIAPAILVLKVIGQQLAPRAAANPVGDERCPSNSSLSN